MPFSLVPFAAKHRAPPCLRRTVASTASGIRLAAVAILSVSVLCLGACTDEPSESQMHQAAINLISERHNAEREAANRQGRVAGPIININKFKKVGCTSATPKPGYNCYYEITADGIDRGKNDRRFYKNENGLFVVAAD